MKLSQTAYEVLSVVVMGETTLQSLAHSLGRILHCAYETRVEIATKALLELAHGDCIRWDFYRNYGNGKPERTCRETNIELLEDLAETEVYLQEMRYDEERDEVTVSVWISAVGQEVLKQADEMFSDPG